MDRLTVDEIWMALGALGSPISHDSILESATRKGLYLVGKRTKHIHVSRLGELTRDLGVYVDPAYVVDACLDK